MKKEFMTKFLVMICLLTLTVGCSNKPSHFVTEPELPDRSPSLSEIAKALGNKTEISKVQSSFDVIGNQIVSLLNLGTIRDELGGKEGLSLSDNMTVIENKIAAAYFIDKTGEKLNTNIAQVAKIVTSTYSTPTPIGIIKGAELCKSSVGCETVNVIILNGLFSSGTENTNFTTAIWAGFATQNEYVYDICRAIYSYLADDRETPLYIAGVSLGGMVAQQIAALPQIRDYWDVKYVLTLASPIVSPEKIDYSETTVTRMVDKDDLVPILSLSANSSYVNGNYEFNYQQYNKDYKKNITANANRVVFIDNQAYSTVLGSHLYTYHTEALLSNIDVLGNENGGASLKLNMDDLKYFGAESVEEKAKELIKK